MSALFLASASPRRRELLAAAGYAPQLLAVDVDESAADFLTIAELVGLNAQRKLRAAVSAHLARLPGGAVVVAADTLVSIDGSVLGKPRDLAEAAAMLARLSGRTHQVLTGVALCCLPYARTVHHFVERTDVQFRPLGPDEIASYLTRIDPLDKAGGYAAQEHGSEIIASVSGSWTNVVGLPMETLSRQLEAFGIRPQSP